MKVIDILNAKEALTLLNKAKFNDFKITSQVYKLTKKFNGVLEMVQQEQQKIIDLYVAKDQNGKPIIDNHQYKFDSLNNRESYINEIEKLRNFEIDDISKIIIPIQAVQCANDISSSEMLSLEPFIEWVD